MFDKILSPYLAWLVIFIITPTLLLWAFEYKMLLRYKATYFHCILTATIAGVIWDIYAINTKVWVWPTNCCTLPRIAGLPLEELLFIAFVTFYACTSTLVARDLYLNHLKHSKK